MGITELAIHNVLRTYSRQDRLGKLQRPRTAAPAALGDKIDLSPKAQKLAAIGRVAEDFVTARFPQADEAQKDSLVRRQTDNLIMSHLGDLESASVTPDSFEGSLRAAYLK